MIWQVITAKCRRMRVGMSGEVTCGARPQFTRPGGRFHVSGSDNARVRLLRAEWLTRRRFRFTCLQGKLVIEKRQNMIDSLSLTEQIWS